MCTVVVKRRLAMVTSIRSAISRSVFSSGDHESFVCRRGSSAATRKTLRFSARNGV